MASTDNKRVIFNVAGECFETFDATLNRFPTTLLGNKKKRDLFYCSRNNEYFFDRNRKCFEAILFYFQSNGVSLRCPTGVLIHHFESECLYFGIPRESINTMMRNEGIIFEFESDIHIKHEEEKKKTLQIQIWNFLENPHSSLTAWLFGIFSLLMVTLSIITVSVKTTSSTSHLDSQLSIVELVINIWFFIELTVRFIFSTCKLDLLCSAMTWIDILAVTPYFVLQKFLAADTTWLVIFNAMKLVKVIRMFPFTKRSCPMKVVGIILRLNIRRLHLLIICLVISIYLGGHIAYLAERDTTGHSNFTSIPQGLWWSVQTITSLGYGDLVTKTLIGRLFACCFMVFGVLTYLPLLSIVSQFITVYPKNVGYGNSIGAIKNWSNF